MPRPRLKTVTLTVRIEPATKEALTALAHVERRSLANMFELIVIERYKNHSVSAPEAPPKKKTTKK